MQLKNALVGIGAALLAAHAAADWQHISLNRYEHGQVLTNQSLGPATAEAINFHHDDSRLVAFDTRERETRDPDLEGPDGRVGYWSHGNIDAKEVIGTVLIIQAGDATGKSPADATILAHPDDEERNRNGMRPGAGEITFAFDRPISGFRFSLFDVEETEAFMNHAGSYVIYERGDAFVKIAFAEFIDRESQYYDPSIRFGDHSANKMPAINAEQIGFDGIDRVIINLGGSGAVGRLGFLEDPVHDVGFGSEYRNDGGGYGDLGLNGSYAEDATGDPGPGPGGSPSPGPRPGPGPGPEGPDDEPFDPVSVPTPGAGIAGTLLMSLLIARRSRRRHRRTDLDDD